MNLFDDTFWIKVILVSWLIIGLWLYWVAIKVENSTQANLSDIRGDMVAVDSVALIAISSPIHINGRVYGNIFLAEDSKLYKIVECESGFDPTVCNKKYGCGSGMGLGQLISSTVEYCEANLNKTIDPFDPEDNLECCMWLLEKDGDVHWRSWSGHCWDK